MSIRIACVCVALAAGSAAADSVFYGFDMNNTGAIPMPSTPNSDAAQAAFFAALSGASLTQDFESFSNGAAPASISFGLGVEAAVTTSAGQIRNTQLNGAHGSDGARFLYSEPSDGQIALTLSFNTPVQAVGFYHTDATDWLGTDGIPHLQVSIGTEAIYELIDGVSTNSIASASTGYFGIIAEAPFTEITIYRLIGGGSTDAIGFDAITVMPVPAPASAALVGLAALATRRRR